jgi:hypothetical protein
MAKKQQKQPPIHGEVRCCVCGKFMGYVEGLPQGEISHGYCPQCFQDAMAQVDAMIADRNNEKARRGTTPSGL